MLIAQRAAYESAKAVSRLGTVTDSRLSVAAADFALFVCSQIMQNEEDVQNEVAEVATKGKGSGRGRGRGRGKGKGK